MKSRLYAALYPRIAGISSRTREPGSKKRETAHLEPWAPEIQPVLYIPSSRMKILEFQAVRLRAGFCGAATGEIHGLTPPVSNLVSNLERVSRSRSSGFRDRLAE